MSDRPWLSILGIGEDGVDGLSTAARRLIGDASLVVGGERHLALADRLIAGERMTWPRPIGDALPAILARRSAPVVVLASGDPFFHGVGSVLARVVPREEFVCLPVASCVSLAASRLGWAQQDVTVISCCGLPVSRMIPHLHDGARLFVLSADGTTPHQLASVLGGRGFGRSVMHVMEALGGARERHRTATADRLPDDIGPLNLVAIEVVADAGTVGIPRAAGLPDGWFAHDGQLTKSEIRAATLAALGPAPGAMLWDIGCGSGSVAIEWCLAHPANRAIGLERDAARAARAAANGLALGVPQFEMRVGEAPAALAGDWPVADAVFIGGGAQSEGVIDAGWAGLRPGGRLVVNAVTIETEAVLFAAMRRLGGSLTRLSVDRLDAVGRMHGFRPAMTVTQFRAVKPAQAAP